MVPATKSYIELHVGTYRTFNDLAVTFINHFQLMVRDVVSTDPLFTFWQDRAMHISDHIQEWHQ